MSRKIFLVATASTAVGFALGVLTTTRLGISLNKYNKMGVLHDHPLIKTIHWLQARAESQNFDPDLANWEGEKDSNV